ncbi:bifunctional phosphopantothenoylcysteine decarboxylase/phosphopantothenate--cysteine ligase CoaBC [Clostridium sp. YIM B02551]|uniref:bifunctional phosphopantothenoylcysteine decarboxylase/phosphopantothenate--cysteine ligase CoaBC n=1 Tax=Clostridium sp. YIM B02551 TaxID=2910679 RepID=UPI001EE9BD57|nr:bifunctional phosphopantothenoylcysteine decarboxylase/phosphopantothenate--cysteine ligase CoaBC [Clostridium sp. YIM B02551]
MNKYKVLIGVTGGIAVYKALDLISKLRKHDIEVKVIMTESAEKFVTPLSFQSLSQNMVTTDMFQEPKAWEIQHISLAKWPDLVLIVPATANIIGKVANGISDDMLSTTIMATKSPVYFAPAMNTNMYENPIVQGNISKLKEYGYGFINPDSGRLACGDVGAGKLAAVDDILEVTLSLLNKNEDLKGKKILITAGPTISPIDPVRFITNRSSGKMGYAIAEEARDRGAEVVLVSGPTNIKPPYGIKFIKVNTNEEMKDAVLDNFVTSDIVIKAAAVADYKIAEYSDKKIKKGEGNLNLEFTRDNDILKILGEKKSESQILVGFAAESHDLIENARRKLANKNLDLIVANDITSNETGFASDDNRVIFITKSNESTVLDKMSKREISKKLLDEVMKISEN